MKASAPFCAGSTVQLAASGAPDRIPLAAGSAQRIFNAGAVTAFVRFGDINVTAGPGDMPLPPGALEIQTVSGTHMAAVTASGNTVLYATGGEGI